MGCSGKEETQRADSEKENEEGMWEEGVIVERLGIETRKQWFAL